MTGLEVAAVLVAGVVAGMMNAVVGSGTLVSFPVLLFVGLPPVTANVSNTIGLVLGSVGGAWGYRRELAGQRRRVLVLGTASLLGGLVGAALLLVLPPHVFRAVVPALIALALVLVIAQPRLAHIVAARHARHGSRPQDAGAVVSAAVFVSGVYGGYFGAAQGIVILGVMGVLLDEHLHRVNAIKNVLVGLVNLTAALFFAVLGMLGMATVFWPAAALLSLGSLLGGLFGGSVGRLVPPAALRSLIMIVGLVAITWLVLG